MSKDSLTPQPPADSGKTRAREDALRANLLKRKQQHRARSQSELPTPTPSKDEK